MEHKVGSYVWGDEAEHRIFRVVSREEYEQHERHTSRPARTIMSRCPLFGWIV